MERAPFLTPAPNGTFLDIYVQPRSGRTGIVGAHGDALKLKVSAPALDGKANAAVLALVADVVGVPLTRVELVRGAKSRSKRLLIHGVTIDDAAKKLAF